MSRNIRKGDRKTDIQMDEGKGQSAGKYNPAKQTGKEDQAGGMKCIGRF